jgi:histidyl-tRNA synthetase
MLHFKEVTSILDMVQIHYTINPRMVRGLDYYTKFAFEFVVAGLGAQNAVVAGGRYDNLVKDLGGPDTPAVGFAAGCERLVLALKSQREVMPFNKTSIDVYVASVEGIEKTTVFTHTQALRRAGLRAIFDWKEKSLKSQLRSADKSAVRFVVIITKDGYVLRDMNTSSQENVSWDDIPIRIKKHMG